MNNLERGVIDIVYSALTGEKADLPEDFNLLQGTKIAKRHKIEAMFYYGAMNCGFDRNSPSMQELFMLTCGNVAASERQMYSVKELFSAFDEAEIDYLPLKGTLLKNYYPKPEMRSMGDADILIKTQQYDEIKKIMNNLGYTENVESDHELIWNKQNIYIELHKRLIPSYNKDYYAYYGDGWQLAKQKNGTCYSMTNEDNMIYLFTHFAKHYRDAGIGIKHITDLWVFRKKHPDLDENYIKNELKALQLYDFYVNIMNTLSVWFENGEADKKTDFITETVFSSGIYGKQINHIYSEALKISKSTKNIKSKKLFSLIFAPYKTMAQKYPLLKKAPFLLPVFWIYRLLNILIFKYDMVVSQKRDFDCMTAENINSYSEALNFVGLDFNFK